MLRDESVEEARAARHARNQVEARTVNDQIAGLPRSGAFEEFVCECGTRICLAPIRISTQEFDEIRRHPGWHVVQPGHASRAHDRVVFTNARYEVTERLPQA